MKLAEALILRADYQRKIEQIKNRLINNAKVQEGEEPSEEPEILLRELDEVIENLTDLIKRINKTNSKTKFNEEMTLADALAGREKLWEKRLILSNLAEVAAVKHDRFSRSEVKYFSTIDIKETQKEVDRLSKEFRILDTKIQGLNWTVDLIS
ncbi:DIP1984 family protein [Clostridium tetani]|uniref:Septicolysin n=1 Tax=Clostridium tetani TaxID=1513 RepID=A0ABY0EL51_CLOTA|nr:DIP1984 family protein [Clostridium tetani]KHO39301.1 hypothetical protein OR62_06175 [Clostridium tetani]RXI51846.1 hypothetical protein DP131_14555 [Clostridium tetani]RXI73929.1 hypothetical protein DQN76_00670 [Clostridium tetani]CDI49296.1 septicolysin [Clostridium tetani 12124569]